MGWRNRIEKRYADGGVLKPLGDGLAIGAGVGSAAVALYKVSRFVIQRQQGGESSRQPQRESTSRPELGKQVLTIVKSVYGNNFLNPTNDGIKVEIPRWSFGKGKPIEQIERGLATASRISNGNEVVAANALARAGSADTTSEDLQRMEAQAFKALRDIAGKISPQTAARLDPVIQLRDLIATPDRFSGERDLTQLVIDANVRRVLNGGDREATNGQGRMVDELVIAEGQALITSILNTKVTSGHGLTQEDMRLLGAINSPILIRSLAMQWAESVELGWLDYAATQEDPRIVTQIDRYLNKGNYGPYPVPMVRRDDQLGDYAVVHPKPGIGQRIPGTRGLRTLIWGETGRPNVSPIAAKVNLFDGLNARVNELNRGIKAQRSYAQRSADQARELGRRTDGSGDQLASDILEARAAAGVAPRREQRRAKDHERNADLATDNLVFAGTVRDVLAAFNLAQYEVAHEADLRAQAEEQRRREQAAAGRRQTVDSFRSSLPWWMPGSTQSRPPRQASQQRPAQAPGVTAGRHATSVTSGASEIATGDGNGHSGPAGVTNGTDAVVRAGRGGGSSENGHRNGGGRDGHPVSPSGSPSEVVANGRRERVLRITGEEARFQLGERFQNLEVSVRPPSVSTENLDHLGPITGLVALPGSLWGENPSRLHYYPVVVLGDENNRPVSLFIVQDDRSRITVEQLIGQKTQPQRTSTN